MEAYEHVHYFRNKRLRLVQRKQHLPSSPANLLPVHANEGSVMSDRIHRADQPAANEQLPRSIWQPGVVKRLADYIKHLREVDQQSNEPSIASERHVCERNPHRTCNCPRRTCADDSESYRYARGPYLARERTPEPNEHGNFQCPITGQLCDKHACRDWCESGVDYTKT